jgi:glycosyltransferase involved in cell wall biosynthesis
VLTAHNALPRRPRALGAWRDALQTAERVVVHSGQTLERLTELGIGEDRLVVIPHPVFDDPVAADASPPSGHTLLFFGLIRHYKGLDVLVRALPEIARHVPEVKLAVAGDPLDPIDPIRELARELGVDERIEWRLGFVPDQEVAPLFARAAFLVLPYRVIESSGVLALALGHGRPAVVSDLGAVGETVHEFGAGRAVPPEDVAALASACVQLLTDESALHESFAGALAARSALTWDEAAKAHEQLYATLRGGASTAPVASR